MKISILASRPVLAATSLALAASLAVSLAFAQGHPPGPPPPQGVPVPKILIIDRQALLRASKVGQDIARQLQVLTRSAQADLKAENDSLLRERQSLAQQVAILAPDVKAEKERAFDAKAQAFQKKVEARQVQIRYGLALAQHQVEVVAGPIIQQLLQERGANIILDRQMIVVSAPGFDITTAAIQRLDQKLPSVKVQLATPPPEMLQRMQAAQQQQ